MAMHKAGMAITLIALAMVGAGCESDYVLGQDTPASLGEGSPTPTVAVTPPEFEATPTFTPPTPEPGAWAAAIRVEPPEVNLGALNVGCAVPVTLTVYNDGTVPIEMTNIRLLGRTVAWDIGFTDDLDVLAPGGSGHIWLTAGAEAVGEDSVELQINATEGLAATVPVWGQVVDEIIAHVDTYIQEPQKNVDVLWVIDNSGSMSDDQKALADNFDAFMNYFVPMGIRYHMGVTTTDMASPTQFGKMQGTYGDGQHYVDWTMREAGDDQFRTTIKKLGSNGSSSERGLSAMQVSLSEEMQSGHNAGFLRADASLAVVFLSDEEDQSPGFESRPATYWQDYVDYLVQLKGAPEEVICSAIVNFADTGGYAEVANATGGVVADIRANYYKTLLEVGRVSAGFENSFDLTADPEEGAQLVVTINGEEVPPGEDTWSFDPETGAVVFAEGAVPEDGDIIDISYSAPPMCEPRYDNPPAQSRMR